ncbi:MAG: T9SS type A sorting domain-containing protein [Flavobacteriales bacterium]
MRSRLRFLLLFLVTSCAQQGLHAQPVVAGYGGSFSAGKITPCANGDFLLTDDTQGSILRIHPDGALVWARSAAMQFRFAGISETASGDLLVALNVFLPDSGYLLPALLRLDANGSLLQARYLHTGTTAVYASRLIALGNGRHALLIRKSGTNFHMLVCLDDGGAVVWSLTSSATPPLGYAEITTGASGGLLALGTDFNGAVMSISSNGAVNWARRYGLSLDAAGTLTDAVPLPSGQLAFIGRAAITSSTWGDFLVLRTQADGTPIDVTPFVHGVPNNFTDGHITANALGDLIVSVNYGSSDELLFGLDPSMSTTWIKHNGNDIPQWGGSVHALVDGTFIHVVKTNETPNVRYFRSDTDQNVEGCYEDFALSQPGSLSVSYTDETSDLQPHAITFSNYSAALSELSVSEMAPCIAQSTVPPNAVPPPRAWPVPTGDELHISAIPVGSRMILCDALGKVWFERVTLQAEEVVDMSQLLPGPYFIILTSDSGSWRWKVIH